MITRVPALEFIQSKAGRYCNADSSVEVLIRRYGYGTSLEIHGPRESRSLGITGVRGGGLEYCVLVGLPNIVHCTGRFKPVAQAGGDGTIEFRSEEARVSLTFSFVGTSVALELQRREFSQGELRFAKSLTTACSGRVISNYLNQSHSVRAAACRALDVLLLNRRLKSCGSI
jgi:hypothetical protein